MRCPSPGVRKWCSTNVISFSSTCLILLYLLQFPSPNTNKPFFLRTVAKDTKRRVIIASMRVQGGKSTDENRTLGNTGLQGRLECGSLYVSNMATAVFLVSYALLERLYSPQRDGSLFLFPLKPGGTLSPLC